ncbi:MAG: Trk family potassium uptake protein [Firmicutes bacterium]|nr:Trk family potassium uptake protein [Bacillota bacterium]
MGSPAGSAFLKLTPSRILILGFAGLILAGTLLLRLPISVRGGSISTIDAVFTATSAVAVTGLVVVDTGPYFTTFGQIVILLLIQFGGLGIMTMATLVAMILGKRITLRARLVLQEALGQITLQGVVRTIRLLVVFSVVMEVLGALLFAIRFVPLFGWRQGLFVSVFHSVSSFNNAGFDLFGNNFASLASFRGDLLVNLVTAGLFVVGGLGFVVIIDLYHHRTYRNLGVQTRFVLALTLLLILLGMFAFLALESGNVLRPLPWFEKLMVSFFTSVTSRTAGFATIDIGTLHPATQFVISFLMFIGASPGGTGGGVKTTTFALLILAVLATVKGREDVVLFEKRFPWYTILKSLAIVMIGLLVVTASTTLLTIFEGGEFLANLFEAVSAFGTVGLSTGITPELTAGGRLIIIFTMYIGRLGPLTLALALGQRYQYAPIRFPEERIMVG